MLNDKAITTALSQTFNDDPRMPRICPECMPAAPPPFFIAWCDKHKGSA